MAKEEQGISDASHVSAYPFLIRCRPRVVARTTRRLGLVTALPTFPRRCVFSEQRRGEKQTSSMNRAR